MPTLSGRLWRFAKAWNIAYGECRIATIRVLLAHCAGERLPPGAGQTRYCEGTMRPHRYRIGFSSDDVACIGQREVWFGAREQARGQRLQCHGDAAIYSHSGLDEPRFYEPRDIDDGCLAEF